MNAIATIGRPSTFSQALADQACEIIADGGSLEDIRSRLGVSSSTLARWLDFDDTFRGNYANAKLLKADSLADAVVPLADSALGKVDAVVTDPPYGIGADKGAAVGGTDASGRYVRRPKQYEGGWDSERPDNALIAAVVAAGKLAIIWGGNYFADALPRGGRWLFWDKLNSMPSYSDGEIAWTNIPGAVVKKITQCNNGLASLQDGDRWHPTQKPEKVMRWCLGFVPDAQTILDPFMGSGTTGVAAVTMGRDFIGVEREAKYFDIALRRIEEAQNQGDLFIKGEAA